VGLHTFPVTSYICFFNHLSIIELEIAYFVMVYKKLGGKEVI